LVARIGKADGALPEHDLLAKLSSEVRLTPEGEVSAVPSATSAAEIVDDREWWNGMPRTGIDAIKDLASAPWLVGSRDLLRNSLLNPQDTMVAKAKGDLLEIVLKRGAGPPLACRNFIDREKSRMLRESIKSKQISAWRLADVSSVVFDVGGRRIVGSEVVEMVTKQMGPRPAESAVVYNVLTSVGIIRYDGDIASVGGRGLFWLPGEATEPFLRPIYEMEAAMKIELLQFAVDWFRSEGLMGDADADAVMEVGWRTSFRFLESRR
jgi:hypothetical protein